MNYDFDIDMENPFNRADPFLRINLKEERKTLKKF